VTFSLPAPKTFHHQGRFLIRIIIFVKSVRRKRSFQLPLFGQAILPSWMIFKSEMVGLNDSAAPEFWNVCYGSGDRPWALHSVSKGPRIVYRSNPAAKERF